MHLALNLMRPSAARSERARERDTREGIFDSFVGSRARGGAFLSIIRRRCKRPYRILLCNEVTRRTATFNLPFNCSTSKAPMIYAESEGQKQREGMPSRRVGFCAFFRSFDVTYMLPSRFARLDIVWLRDARETMSGDYRDRHAAATLMIQFLLDPRSSLFLPSQMFRIIATAQFASSQTRAAIKAPRIECKCSHARMRITFRTWRRII